ncbi:Uncharacterised protein [Pseudomonas putida]|nr:hypothetical protein DM483_16205 [Pseudomonas sp. SMT-1]QDW55571.1 hypothetical protein FFH79_001205 [Pseudomonas sp. KBS0802]UZA77104.1 hypothetical protein EZZ80_27920 [Pseudomonas putida]SKC17592.1 hypothetical protein SAMN05216307_4570 [Pseudomonas putida]SMQ02127.1 hypothetical protein SAMN05216380_3032 [Pseudomonas putida]
MNGFSKGILLLNTGSGPAFFIEQAFKLNMDRISMRIGALIGVVLLRPFRGLALPYIGMFFVGAGLPAKRPAQAIALRDQFLSWQSSCRLA